MWVARSLTLTRLARQARNVAFLGMFFVTLTAASLYSLLAPFFPSVAGACARAARSAVAGVAGAAAAGDAASFGSAADRIPPAAKRGVHQGAVGFVFASFSLVVFLSSPAFGVHMARLGQRNTLFCGLALLSAATVGFGFMERVGTGATFFGYCICMRVAQGLGSAAVETASYAIAATLFPESVTSVLGILEVANGLGYVVGPPLGGLLYNYNPMLPFLVVGLCPVPVLLALMHLLPRTLGEGCEPSDWSKLRAVASRRGVQLVCAAAVLGEGSFAFVEPVLEPFLVPLTAASSFVQTTAGGHHAGVGLIYAVVSVVYSAVVPAVGLLSRRDRLGTRSVMVLGLASISFGFLLLAPSPLLSWALPAPTLLGVAAGMAFLGLGQSFALVPNMACLLEVCEDMPEPEATTNVCAGVLNAAYSAGSMLAPIASSFLGVRLPFRWSTTIWAAALAAMAACLSFAWDGQGAAGGGAGADGSAAGASGAAAAGGAMVGAGIAARLRSWRAAASAWAAGKGGADKAGGVATGGGGAAGTRRRRVRQLALLGLAASAVLVLYYGSLLVYIQGRAPGGGVLGGGGGSAAAAVATAAAGAGGVSGVGSGGGGSVAAAAAAVVSAQAGGVGGAGAHERLASSSDTAVYYNAVKEGALKTSSSEEEEAAAVRGRGAGVAVLGAAAATQQQKQPAAAAAVVRVVARAAVRRLLAAYVLK